MKTLRKLLTIKRSLVSIFLLSIPILTYGLDRGPIAGINSDSRFIVYYGNDYYLNTSGTPSTWILNESTINSLAQFDVVVVQPNQWLFTPEVVHELKQRGVDQVLGYISIGEDFINDALESPLANGSGMMEYDNATGTLIPSTGNTLQSFYVDVDSQNITYNSNGTITGVTTTARLTPDGIPDLNPTFLGYMVNPDANWRWVIDNMRIGTNDVNGRTYKAGLQQLAGDRPANPASRNRSDNFGFDGFFLDTIDTAGPYDGAGWYPWTISEMQATVKYISDSYPDKTIMANRGAFFFSPGLVSPITNEYTIDYNIRPYVNAFLFESFRYDSDPSIDGASGVSEFFNENRFNIAPKVFAEANRPDGFSMFSLEYESGRSGIVNDAFNTDIRQFGYVGYLTSQRALDTIDFDFLNKLPDGGNDLQGPVWDSTGHTAYNTPNTIMRVGVQNLEVSPIADSLIVSWDVAMDQSHPITYDIVVTDKVTNQQTTHEDVPFITNTNWLHNPSLHSANSYTVSNLDLTRQYNIRVVATDAKGNANTQDTGLDYIGSSPVSNPILRSEITFDGLLNEWSSFTQHASDPDDVVETSPPGHFSGQGNQANWRQIQLAHTTDTSELIMGYTNETNIYISWGFQVFIDSDKNTNTGFNGSFGGIGSFPIGADYLIEGVNVYQYNGSGNDWNWIVSPNSGGFEMGRIWSGHTGEVFLPLHWIGSPQSGFNFIVFGNNDFYVSGNTPVEFDWYPDSATQGGFFEYQF